MKCNFTHGTESFEYILKRRARKTIAIQVHRDTLVEVIAPIKAPLAVIHDLLKMRGSWILKKIDFFKAHPPKASEWFYYDGEIHYYLGKPYALKTELAIQSGVEIDNQFIIVKSHYPRNRSLTKQLIDAWFLEKALEHFNQLTETAMMRFAKPALMRPKKIIIKSLKRKWGSMSTHGTMTLNLKLIHTSIECIDYVITHELCHIIHHNHSKNFWGLVAEVMPDWKDRKKKLELAH